MDTSLVKRLVGVGFLFAPAFFLAVSGAAGQEFNTLIIVADDVGVDSLRTYCRPPADCTTANLPATPNIDALRARGILFNKTWGNSSCSPTRSTMQTGRYARRTGVGVPVAPFGLTFGLPRCEYTIPEVLGLNVLGGHEPAAIGKWHLGTVMNGGPASTNQAGYQHFAGTAANIGNYFNWPKNINGRLIPSYATYATTDNVNEAIAFIQQQAGPWFVWLAFNAPHSPYQAPPANLHSRTLPVAPGQICPSTSNATRRPCYLAMLEAEDTEIGRLLSEIPQAVLDKTTIIFVGDNGTPCEVCDQSRPECAAGRCKFSLYQGGINVPLIISGAQVERPNSESDALVNTTDIFATVIDLLTGVGPQMWLPPTIALDSVSLVPLLNGSEHGSLRQHAYSEILTTLDHDQTIRNDRFKLIRFTAPGPMTEEFYDLNDPELAVNNLLDGRRLRPQQEENLESLRAELDRMNASTLNDCDGDEFSQPLDNCTEVDNPGQVDSDGDRKGDPCDDCPATANSARNAPVAQVTFPNGGQTFLRNTEVTLTWNATDDCAGTSITTVELLLSRTGPDGTFERLTPPGGIANSGSFNWIVTGPPTNGFTGFLKVVGHNSVGSSGLDWSDSGFKIENLGLICSCPDYCEGEGVRCKVTSCGPGDCCNFTCGPDPSCTSPDPLPINACQ